MSIKENRRSKKFIAYSFLCILSINSLALYRIDRRIYHDQCKLLGVKPDDIHKYEYISDTGINRKYKFKKYKNRERL